jgi:phosphoglycerate dehydrogenase-like enzyme
MRYKIAVLDDYQNVAFQFADWTAIKQQADVDLFSDHLFNESEIIERLKPYQVVCVMRERTPLTRSILEQLPNLKLIVSTGQRNASIDTQAAEDLKIGLQHTGYVTTGAPEMTWAVLMALARHIPSENQNVRLGGWQTTIGTDLSGKTIGIIGLGRIGNKIAGYAKAFDMNVLAWSQNLTEEKATAAGAKLVSKETLLQESDFVTIHLLLSERTRAILKTEDLRLMKPTAFLVNTSRGPLIEEQGLIEILKEGKIAGAALDVFDTEPLYEQHPFRNLENVLATPHIGYVTEATYRVFFEDMVKAIEQWLETRVS